MTDITALVQRLKAAADNDTYPVLSPDDCRALVEALEKAQRANTTQQDRIDTLEKRNAELGREVIHLHALKTVNTARQEAESEFHRGYSCGHKDASLELRTVTAAAADVLAERQRQVTAEGWTPEHDDEHSDGEMALAASSYALYAHKKPIAPAIPYNWPWEPEWFKQQGARRDLVKAGALILAEIERLDRAAGIKVEVE